MKGIMRTLLLFLQPFLPTLVVAPFNFLLDVSVSWVFKIFDGFPDGVVKSVKASYIVSERFISFLFNFTIQSITYVIISCFICWCLTFVPLCSGSSFLSYEFFKFKLEHFLFYFGD
jgi:hypothetical protein